MPTKQPPMLMASPFSKKVFVVTRYKTLDAEKGQYEAIDKYPINDQFEQVAKQLGWTPPKKEQS